MLRGIVAASLVALVSACASQPKTADVASQTLIDEQCYNYYETGSNVPKHVCVTKEQAAAQEKADREAVQKLQQALQQSNLGAPPK